MKYSIINNYSITTYIILAQLFLLTGCVAGYRHIEELRDYGYDIYAQPPMLRGVTLYKYHSGNFPSQEEISEKTIGYGSDSTVENLFYSFRSADETKRAYLVFSTEVVSANIYPYLNPELDTLLEFEFEQYMYDSTSNLHVYLDSEYGGGKLELTSESDTFYLHREFEISEEVKNHYWMLKEQLVDSVGLMTWPQLPDIRSCDKLIYSEYLYTTCLIEQEGYFRQIHIDSSKNGEIWTVNRDTVYYNQIENKNEDGSTTYIYKSKSIYDERVEISSQGYPVYLKSLTFNPDTGDTLTSLEMTSKKNKKNRSYEYKYKIYTPKEAEKAKGQIIEQHISLERNKKGQIIYYRVIGYTQSAYKVELERVLKNEIWTTLKNENTILEIDSTVTYNNELSSFLDFIPVDIYILPHRQKGKSYSVLLNYREYRKYFKQSGCSSQKDRKNKIEIWTNADSSQVYEVKYGLK